MEQFAQLHLAALIAGARMGPHQSMDESSWKSSTFAAFRSALSALEAVGAVSKEEDPDWTNRILVALGEEPLEPLEPSVPGVSTARLISFGRAKAPQRPPDPAPASKFLALVPVNEPDRPLPYGGRLQILSVELYSDRLTVNWRLAPEPDYEAVYAEELAAQAGDLEGLPEQHQKIMRQQLLHRLQGPKQFISLSDDVGTGYFQGGGGSSGGGGEKRGHADFRPAVPEGVSQLSIVWDDLERFEVQLPQST
jgi:hypothetical protein